MSSSESDDSHLLEIIAGYSRKTSMMEKENDGVEGGNDNNGRGKGKKEQVKRKAKATDRVAKKARKKAKETLSTKRPPLVPKVVPFITCLSCNTMLQMATTPKPKMVDASTQTHVFTAPEDDYELNEQWKRHEQFVFERNYGPSSVVYNNNERKSVAVGCESLRVIKNEVIIRNCEESDDFSSVTTAVIRGSRGWRK